MSDGIQVNRPVVSTQPGAAAPVQSPAEPSARSSKLPWIVLGIVVVVLVAVGLLFRDNLFGKKAGEEAVLGVSTAKYQAVFLTNGQVYFGKISNTDDGYVTLKDIYYLQVVQPPLQGQQPEGGAQQQPQQQISLVKLGNELHGPVDEMHISRSQILFFEDLKEEGQVVQAIVTDKNTKK